MKLKPNLSTGKKYFWCTACKQRKPQTELASLQSSDGALCKSCHADGWRLRAEVVAYKTQTEPKIIRQKREGAHD